MTILHRGATAEVREVPESGSGVPAVEKRLLPHASHSAEARADLEREGAILAALAGRGVPILLARGEDDRGLYVRLARGPETTLASLEPERVQAHFGDLLRAALTALSSVHDASDGSGPLGVVHGDITGPNVLVTPSMDAVLFVDFQLARWREGGPPLDGSFRGTFDTVAPEVARGEPPTVKSDLFSLAATLVQAALGRSLRAEPATGRVEAARVVRAAEVPVDASGARAFTSPPMAHALAACLSHDPAARPSSTAHVRELAFTA